MRFIGRPAESASQAAPADPGGEGPGEADPLSALRLHRRSPGEHAL